MVAGPDNNKSFYKPVDACAEQCDSLQHLEMGFGEIKKIPAWNRIKIIRIYIKILTGFDDLFD